MLLLSATLATLCVIGAFASPKAEAEPISLRWEFLGNNVPRDGLCSAELTLSGINDLDASGRELFLYFNYGRKPAGIDAAGSAPIYEHVNGDLFRLPIGADSIDSAENKGLRLRMVSAGAIKNLTDAPAGFFLVIRDGERTEHVRSLDVQTDLSVLRDSQRDLSSTSAAERPVPPSAATQAPSPPLIPQPLLYEKSPGLVGIDGLAIVCGKPSVATAELLADAIGKAGGANPTRLAQLDPSTPAIRLGLGDVQIASGSKIGSDEAYILEATPELGVRITGSDPAGLFYGVQTLIALIQNAPTSTEAKGLWIPSVVIRDAPHFSYRGLHLDVARNFQSPATVRKVLDLMSAYKLNRFHLHLTDDEGWRLAIRGLPELTSVGARRGYSPELREFLPPSFGSGPDAEMSPGSGHYTREDFIALLRYAASRHIEVVPEIDLPGHARAAIRSMRARYERLHAIGHSEQAERFLLRRPGDGSEYESVQMWKDNVVDVRLASTSVFVQHVVDDLASMYREAGLSLETIHFGGDEVPAGCWGTTEGAEVGALFFSFMDRCAEIAQTHRARSAGWEEVFVHGDQETGAASQGLCYVWNNLWGWGQEDVAYQLANAGTDVVLCSATHLYFDLAHQMDPMEPGYYWAGTTDTQEAFHFRPYRFFEGDVRDRSGNPVNKAEAMRKASLTDAGRDHILGIQGQLWGENLVSGDRLEYLAFPRVLALAERAWVGPPIAERSPMDPPRGWGPFARHLGERELPRLDRLFGGVRYRIPDPRILASDDSVEVDSALPGMAVHFTADGSNPTRQSDRYTTPLPRQAQYRFRVFNTEGRGGRTIAWRPNPTTEAEK